MTKTLSRTDYYLSLCYYMLASQFQKKVREYEKLLSTIVREDKINDSMYDPSSDGTKDEYDNLLLDAGIEVQWKDNKTTEGAIEKIHDKP